MKLARYGTIENLQTSTGLDPVDPCTENIENELIDAIHFHMEYPNCSLDELHECQENFGSWLYRALLANC